MGFYTKSVSRKYRTTFAKIPHRGEFTFASGSPAGTWVKTGRHSYAAPATVRSGIMKRQGDPVSYTGKTAYYTGSTSVTNTGTLVFTPNPAVVHQEQDKVAW